jgi:hypothetical protein
VVCRFRFREIAARALRIVPSVCGTTRHNSNHQQKTFPIPLKWPQNQLAGCGNPTYRDSYHCLNNLPCWPKRLCPRTRNIISQFPTGLPKPPIYRVNFFYPAERSRGTVPWHKQRINRQNKSRCQSNNRFLPAYGLLLMCFGDVYA